jgi:hypothetical protein
MASILLANGANSTQPDRLTLEAPLHLAVRQKQYQVLLPPTPPPQPPLSPRLFYSPS